jgi:signal transduction histidine kinase
LRAYFDLAYKRFEDLKSAERQHREAQIELALERVRARTMAMQHSDELADASRVLDEQVRALGIETWGCAFHIYADNADGDYEWFSSANGNLPFYKTPRENFFLRFYEKGQRGETFHIEEFAGEDCKAHYDFLKTLPVAGDALKALEESGIPLPDYQIDHIAFFSHGYILFITYEPVPEAHEIFPRFARVFEQTYTRFLDLQKAEAQALRAENDLIAIKAARHKAEEALTELKATQEQLVQQEKLASLGQLTAGIAHEIKNPLNFVNNFSEVSIEMIEEALEELGKTSQDDHTAETAAILADIKSNLAKIHEHGSRADGIVKSMLMHSRGGRRQNGADRSECPGKRVRKPLLPRHARGQGSH